MRCRRAGATCLRQGFDIEREKSSEIPMIWGHPPHPCWEARNERFRERDQRRASVYRFTNEVRRSRDGGHSIKPNRWMLNHGDRVRRPVDHGQLLTVRVDVSASGCVNIQRRHVPDDEQMLDHQAEVAVLSHKPPIPRRSCGTLETPRFPHKLRLRIASRNQSMARWDRQWLLRRRCCLRSR